MSRLLQVRHGRDQKSGSFRFFFGFQFQFTVPALKQSKLNEQRHETKIFKKYDSSLYRIAVYENGSLKRHIGKMSEMQIGEVAREYSNNARATGLTNWTMQIGLTTHVTTSVAAGSATHVMTAGSPTHVTTAGSPTHVTTHGSSTHITKIPQESDALVKEVTPILEKYSR